MFRGGDTGPNVIAGAVTGPNNWRKVHIQGFSFTLVRVGNTAQRAILDSGFVGKSHGSREGLGIWGLGITV